MGPRIFILDPDDPDVDLELERASRHLARKREKHHPGSIGHLDEVDFAGPQPDDADFDPGDEP